MTRHRRRCSPFLAAAFRAFRWQTRQLPSSRLSASALLLAASVLWAVATVSAERAYLRAARASEASVILLETLRAEARAPWNARIRETNAHLLARLETVPPAVALMALRRAIDQAPGNARHYLDLFWTLVRAGDEPQAAEALAVLKGLAPDWPETRAAAAAMKEATR